MPTLPVYESNQNITPSLNAPPRNESSQVFEDQQKVIGTLTKITQDWSAASDVMEYTEAKAKHGLAVMDIESRAALDPDFKNSEKYHKELQAVRKDATSGISNQQVASRAAVEFDYDDQVAKIKIENGFRQKQVAYNKVMVKTNMDTLIQKKLSAATPAEAQKQDLEIEKILAESVKSGVLSLEEADVMLTKSQETAVKYQVYADNSTQEKDSETLKELKKHDGKYSFLDPDTRLKMIEENQRRIFQNNQTFKRETEVARDNRFNEIFTKSNEGTLTLNDLDREMQIPEEDGGIPKKELLSIRKAIQTRIKTDLEAITDSNDTAYKYSQFVDNFISDETDRQKGREAIVNAFSDGILSSKEAAFLNSLKRETEAIKTLKEREQFMGNNLVPFKNAVNAVNDFFTGKKNFTESEKALAIKELLSGSAEGGNPQDLSQQIIIDTTIKKNPNILNLSPEGQIVVDENGFLKIMNNKAEVKEHTDKPATPKKPASKEKK